MEAEKVMPLKLQGLACYLCGSTRKHVIAKITEKPGGETDFGIKPGKYLRYICRCSDCSVYFNVHEHIKPDFYTGQYNEATYKHNIYDKYQKIRNLPAGKSDNKQRVERIAAFLANRGISPAEVTALDVGSGLCVFAAELKDRGFSCYCIDPDPAAVEHALTNVKAEGAHAGTLDDFQPPVKFNLITFNKVLEHLRAPVRELAKAKDLLSKDGVVYIELPDADGALKHGTEIDRGEFHIEHYTVYNREALAFLAEKAGFEILNMKCIDEPSGKCTIYAFLKPGRT